MNNAEDEKEVIKVIIVNEDGTESEVDASSLIKVEISNKEDDFETIEDDAVSDEDEALLLDNIKVEMIDDPVQEFGEYILSQNLEEYSEKEYFHQYIEHEENNPSRKRKRGRPSTFEANKRKKHTCDICGYESYQKSHYRRHLAIHSKPEGIFCSICRKEMSGKSELSNHMDEHRCSFDVDRFQCNLCDYSSKKLTNVSQHTEIHYKPEKTRFECEICDFSATNRTSFKKHLNMHGNSRHTRCPVCLIAFKTMSARRRHLLKYKNGPDPNKYQCPECSYRTAKFNNFKQHMVVHRNEYEIEMFQCLSCPFKSKRKTDLRQHVIVKHKTDEEVLLFKCDFCSYESRRGNHLTSHMKNRHSREIIVKKCGLCSYKTVSQVLIEKHCNIHSKVPEHFFLCSLCGEGFLSPKLLRGHMEVSHSNNNESVDVNVSEDERVPKVKREPCDDEGYSVELCRIENDEDYTGNEEFETFYCCQFPQCDFRSTIERDAKIHKSISHNKRGDDNRCPECTFHTTSRYLYLDHLKVHKIDIEHLKPHLCDICGTRWIRQGDLTRHMSVHWGLESEKRKRSPAKLDNQSSDKKLLECALCSYSTRLRLCLYKHMLKHGEEHQQNFNLYVEDDIGDVTYPSDELYEDDPEDYD